MNTQQSEKRRLFVRILLLMFAAALPTYFHWKDMSQTLPSESELASVEANTFRRDEGESSIEFFDPQGHRYQANDLERSEKGEIRTAIESGVPVRLFYGRWRSPISSNKISTVYSIELGDRVLIPYERAAQSQAKQRESRVPVMVMTALLVGGALFWGMKRGAWAKG